jgi:hypothetical protein
MRVGEHQPGERQLLGLGRREGVPTGADERGQPVRQLLRPVQRVHRGQRCAYLRLGRVGPDHRQVVVQRTDEDVVLLGDQRDLPAQLVEGQFGQRYPAEGDRAGPWRMDAGEQAAEGGLAGT